ncbi:cation:proton antiporter [Sphingobium sp. WTD-1]|uniref:cation:proton antiporter n=1 Tax=Sphingobium sp. WTD-1 TaxID=2979467 RepID=UPI0024DEDE6A|nr:cation:proton antiporter [Sphingobium sp. WTD-1]WIA56838.1 cation:proton antiporter [Sphingobium sp. WTD-1]
MDIVHVGAALALQLVVILGTCRLVGWLAGTYFHQPRVIGDMIAGILLGPSFFGLVAPQAQSLIFPAETKPILYIAAQIGIGLYMFLVGLGFRRDHFYRHAGSAVAVSLCGIVAPFLVAVALTPWLLQLEMFGHMVTAFEATLFMGVAISITAFPVLARIINERGLAHTPLASLALSAGAIDDAIAWSILAILLACIGVDNMIAVKALGGGGLFAAVMLLLAPGLMRPLARWAEREGRVTFPLLAVVVMLFSASAWAMDAAGLHSVFGGFLLGVVMPRGLLARGIKVRLEPVTTLLLVPLFFTFSGLNTRLTMVDTPVLAFVALTILAGSILAKGGGCWAAARMTGQDNPTALAVGALMNARGLMELLVINIGLQRGIIGPALFAILALMTIVTTIMTSPAIDILSRKKMLGGPIDGLNDNDVDPRSATSNAGAA